MLLVLVHEVVGDHGRCTAGMPSNHPLIGVVALNQLRRRQPVMIDHAGCAAKYGEFAVGPTAEATRSIGDFP